MENIVEKVVSKRFSKIKTINIPNDVEFGLEIENNGLSSLRKLKNAERVIRTNLPKMQSNRDDSLFIHEGRKILEYGFELTTPVLTASDENIQLLKDTSRILKSFDTSYNRSSFQLNFNDDFDEEERLYLLKLYTYFEPVIARFCRGVNPKLRDGVFTFAQPLYPTLMNRASYLSKDIIKRFTDSKMGAINFKLEDRSRRIIEFRLPNGTNDFHLWFNYITMFSNLLDVVKNKSIEDEELNDKLRYMYLHYNSQYGKQYKCFPIKENLVNEFVNTVYDEELDKYHFMKQYINENKPIEKALN